MPTCRASLTFAASLDEGSPPFKTGFHFDCNSTGDLDTTLENIDIWWTAATAFRNKLDVELGKPVLTVSGEFSGIVFESSMEATDAAGGSEPALPGVSLRVVALGSRPVGGRNGAMYWPGLEEAAHTPNGALTSDTLTTAATAMTGLRNIIEDIPGQFIATVHKVGGTTSVTPVTDHQVSSTVSFLQRRYR